MPRLLFAIILCSFVVGCATKPATLKGSFSLNGKPFAIPKGAGQVFAMFQGMGTDGKPDIFKTYTGVVNADGTFEVQSSAGELPPGSYLWSIDCDAVKVPEFAAFTHGKSKGKVEVKSGPNVVVLDLSAK